MVTPQIECLLTLVNAGILNENCLFVVIKMTSDVLDAILAVLFHGFLVTYKYNSTLEWSKEYRVKHLYENFCRHMSCCLLGSKLLEKLMKRLILGTGKYDFDNLREDFQWEFYVAFFSLDIKRFLLFPVINPIENS